ncbi:MAG: hypothetical protein ACE5DP_00240 [Fidelibacterota bacterium]
MTLPTIIGLFLGTIVFILLLLYLPIRIVATGAVVFSKKQSMGIGRLWLGSKTFGLGLEILPRRCIVFGPHDHPWIKAPLPMRTKKTPTRTGTRRKKKRPKQEFASLLKVWRAGMAEIQWEYLAIKGRLELQNPMYTGLIVGSLNWLAGMIPSPRVNLGLEPHFSPQLNTHLKGQVRFRVQPARLAWRVGTTYFKYRK